MNTKSKNSMACLLAQLNIAQTGWRKVHGLFLAVTLASSFSASVLLDTLWETEVGASSPQVKILEIPFPTGITSKILTFPLYEQESIQYFSAGLGKEERSLTYPPFPLKLIFVQGERAYLAGVSVDIENKEKTRYIKIPGEEVEGPWLFINLPTGTYLVRGSDSHGTTIEKTVRIKTDESTEIHLRFP